MRYLHAVTMREKFVASGVYTHYRDGEPTGTTEEWSIHQQPDGATFYRIDEDSRKADGGSVLVEAWQSPPEAGSRIERVDVSAFGPKGSEVLRVRSTYTVMDDFLEAGRTIDDADRQQVEIELPFGYVIAPENLIFAGYEVSHLALSSGKPGAVVSYLPTFLNPSLAFRPTVYEQIARFVDDVTIKVDGKSYLSRHYEQTNPLTSDVLTLWLDEHDVLLRYTSADGHYSADLSQYSRRPEGKKS